MRNLLKSSISILALTFLFSCSKSDEDTEVEKEIATRWSVEKAQEWGDNQPWLVGANFNPSTSSNQLEMWQAASFDLETIDKELGWAEDIGMNTMRVYLHHVAWQYDQEGFKSRINQYLEIADNHGIKTMFVFFDDCWNDTYA
ncbi:MAG: 1,4-beta-xylanase, partial [Flavobacteriales bacterium]|nr:1,4-beta-xylanase [Flavobacteriales bacterium]